MLSEIPYHLVRAVQLLAISIAPRVFSPEPSPPENLLMSALLAVLVLGAVLYGAFRLRTTVDTAGARAAAGMTWIAVAAALGATLFFRGERAPLARGAAYIAIPVWAALAAVASTAAGHFLGSDWKNRRMMALVVVLGIGSLQYAYAGQFLASPDKMWRDALRRDADNEAALTAMSRGYFRSHKYEDAKKLADRCLAMQPEACACREARAEAAMRKVSDRCLAKPPETCACLDGATEAELRKQAIDEAVTDARAAIESCPERAKARAVHAEALALRGDHALAEQEATVGLSLGGREDRVRYALALALQGQGKYDEATEQLDEAIRLGAGRDAKLLAGALALMKGDLDGAERFLTPLAGPTSQDAVASYNLALVADKRGNYNLARQGYLSTLKVDPCYGSARYNLVFLTWKAGIQEEARHHARKFAETAAPGDPMVDQLSALVGVNLRAPEGAPDSVGSPAGSP